MGGEIIITGMDKGLNISFSHFEDTSVHNSLRKGESDELYERRRISSLTKAAEISPHVKEVTIGPNSPLRNNDNEYTMPVMQQKIPKENVIDHKICEDRYSLIIQDYEKKIQEITYQCFLNLYKNMLTKQAAMTQFWEKQGKECNRRTDWQSRKLQMLRNCQENDNLYLLEQARIDEKNCPILNTRTIENMNRIFEEQNRATARFAAITDSYTKICICYNEIFQILNTGYLGKFASEKYRVDIDTVISNIYNIMNILKTGVLSDKDVKQADILAKNMENIKSKVLKDIETLEREQIMKKIEEDELLKKKELEEKEAQEIKVQQAALAEKIETAPPKKTIPLFFSPKNYSYYEDLKNYLDQYESQYNDLLQDVNQKKFRFDCQKAVNTPVNALSSVSALHMRDKYDKLAKLLKGERVQVLDTYVQASQHPQGLAYCAALLAKKIVRQGDLLVSSNTEAAYPLAAVTIALWAQFPHFGKLVEAYFHRLCPYLVPMFLPQKEGQTDKEFYLSRGYTYNNEGVIEKQDKFLKRMTGIFRLRCAIWTAKMPKFLTIPHPQKLGVGWQWLASFINLKPEPDISATLLHDFYIMCGSTFYKFYGKQFRKILELTSTQYLKILENIDEGGPKTRLEVYLQNVLKTNDVPPPPASSQQINW